jgi:hypothetical protein
VYILYLPSISKLFKTEKKKKKKKERNRGQKAEGVGLQVMWEGARMRDSISL